jgi:hypothetical protein
MYQVDTSCCAYYLDLIFIVLKLKNSGLKDDKQMIIEKQFDLICLVANNLLKKLITLTLEQIKNYFIFL